MSYFKVLDSICKEQKEQVCSSSTSCRLLNSRRFRLSCRKDTSEPRKKSPLLVKLESFRSISVGCQDWRNILEKSNYSSTQFDYCRFKNTIPSLISAITESQQFKWNFFEENFPCFLPFCYEMFEGYKNEKLNQFYSKQFRYPSFTESLLGVN